MTETQRKDIVAHTMEVFVEELVDAIQDGWAISPTCPGDALLGYGTTFTVSLYRDDNTVEKFRKLSANVEEKPKMTRAESLAKARETKAALKATLDVNNVKN